jgi:hypothetical protein
MKKSYMSGIIAVIFAVFIFSSCDQPDANVDTEQVKVIIPAGTKVKETGRPPFKVYVQFSDGQKATDGYVAEGAALMSDGELAANGSTALTIALYHPGTSNVWKGQANNAAITLSPEWVAGFEDIEIKGNVVSHKEAVVTYNWNDMLPIEGAIITADDKKALYQGIVFPDDDIKGPDGGPPSTKPQY